MWRFPHKPRLFTTRYQGDFTQPCIFGTEFTCTGVGFTPAILGLSESGWYRIHPTHFHSPQAQASPIFLGNCGIQLGKMVPISGVPIPRNRTYCRQFAARPRSSHATAGSTEVGNLYCWNRHQKQQMSAQKGRDSSLTYHVLLVPKCPPDPRECGSRKSSPDRAHVITRELAIPAEGRRCALMVQAQVVCQI